MAIWKRYGRGPGLWPAHLCLHIDTYMIQVGGKGLSLHLAGVLARGALSEGNSPLLQPGAKAEGGNKLKKLALPSDRLPLPQGDLRGLQPPRASRLAPSKQVKGF